MPTAIAVTSADLVLPPTDQQTPTAAVLPALETQSLGATVADLQLLLDRYGHVVVVVPTSLPKPAEQRLHAVRSLLESDRIALVKTDLPPLGSAVLARQLRQLSVCDFSPGVVASAARLLAHYIYAGAVLGTVAKLDRVPVGLKSHVKGWLPGAQFAVLAGPAPHLTRIGSGVAPPAGPEFATQLVLARGQLQTDWPTTTLAPTWQVQAVHEAPLPAGSPRWWGTGRLVEFTAYLSDIAVLHRLVASVRRETCHWCRMELIGDRCGFCAAPWVAPATPTPTPTLASASTSKPTPPSSPAVEPPPAAARPAAQPALQPATQPAPQPWAARQSAPGSWPVEQPAPQSWPAEQSAPGPRPDAQPAPQAQPAPPGGPATARPPRPPHALTPPTTPTTPTPPTTPTTPTPGPPPGPSAPAASATFPVR
ncbi:hypothetical protein ACIPPS_03845 [Streptomyces sp. NPDC090127]|uniref:hypothetical protein n=1 Tax=Streptomyces sp. NPDC090127 TaxID=3365953 RepID=UPI00380C9FBF